MTLPLANSAAPETAAGDPTITEFDPECDPPYVHHTARPVPPPFNPDKPWPGSTLSPETTSSETMIPGTTVRGQFTTAFNDLRSNNERFQLLSTGKGEPWGLPAKVALAARGM